MTRVYFAIALCAGILSLTHVATKVPVPIAGTVLLADDGGPLPPPCQPDPPCNA